MEEQKTINQNENKAVEINENNGSQALAIINENNAVAKVDILGKLDTILNADFPQFKNINNTLSQNIIAERKRIRVKEQIYCDMCKYLLNPPEIFFSGDLAWVLTDWEGKKINLYCENCYGNNFRLMEGWKKDKQLEKIGKQFLKDNLATFNQLENYQTETNAELTIIRQEILNRENQHIEQLEGLRNLMEDTEKKKNEELRKSNEEIARLKTKATEIIEQERAKEAQRIKDTKLLQSKEKAEYEAINEKYQELEAQATTDKERVNLLSKANSEYITLICKLDHESKILAMRAGEYEAAESERKILVVEKALLENETETLKGQIELITNQKDRVIKRFEEAAEIQVVKIKELEKKDLNHLRTIGNFKAEVLEKNQELKEAEWKIEQANTEKQQLQTEKKTLQDENTKLNDDLTKQTQQKRLGNLFAAGVFATDYLPIPKKWQSGIKNGFNAAQAWQVAADIPQATYEVIIGFTAIVVWYAIRSIYYRVFNRKEINQVKELQDKLQANQTELLLTQNKLREAKESKEEKGIIDVLPEAKPVKEPKKKPKEIKSKSIKKPKKGKAK